MGLPLAHSREYPRSAQVTSRALQDGFLHTEGAVTHWTDRTPFVLSAQDRTGRAKSEVDPKRENTTPPLPPLLLLNASAAHIPVCLQGHWESVLPGDWNAEVCASRERVS